MFKYLKRTKSNWSRPSQAGESGHCRKKKEVKWMPFGGEIYGAIPDMGYMLVHLIELGLGLYLWNMWKAKNAALSWLALIYGITGLLYLVTHPSGGAVLHTGFTHLLDRVLFLVAFLLVWQSKK